MKSIFVLTDSRISDAIRACTTMEKAVTIAIRRIALFNYDCQSFNYNNECTVIEYIDRNTGTVERLTISETIFDEEE